MCNNFWHITGFYAGFRLFSTTDEVLPTAVKWSSVHTGPMQLEDTSDND